MRPYRVALLATILVSACARHEAPPAPPPPPAAKPAPPPAPTPARIWTKGTARVPVIMYHDVVAEEEIFFDLTTREFRRQLAALRAAGAHVVRLADIAAHLRDGKPIPERPIALTFDDGTRGLYTTVYPLLKQYGYPATFFVHTGYVGRPSASKQHMTWDQLREVERSGLVDVEPHTVNHPLDLKLLSAKELTAELGESKARVERELGKTCRYFAFTSEASSNEQVARALVQLGYEAAWNEVRGADHSPADRFALPRYTPRRFDEALEQLQDGR